MEKKDLPLKDIRISRIWHNSKVIHPEYLETGKIIHFEKFIGEPARNHFLASFILNNSFTPDYLPEKYEACQCALIKYLVGCGVTNMNDIRETWKIHEME